MQKSLATALRSLTTQEGGNLRREGAMQKSPAGIAVYSSNTYSNTKGKRKFKGWDIKGKTVKGKCKKCGGAAEYFKTVSEFNDHKMIFTYRIQCPKCGRYCTERDKKTFQMLKRVHWVKAIH